MSHQADLGGRGVSGEKREDDYVSRDVKPFGAAPSTFTPNFGAPAPTPSTGFNAPSFAPSHETSDDSFTASRAAARFSASSQPSATDRSIGEESRFVRRQNPLITTNKPATQRRTARAAHRAPGASNTTAASTQAHTGHSSEALALAAAAEMRTQAGEALANTLAEFDANDIAAAAAATTAAELRHEELGLGHDALPGLGAGVSWGSASVLPGDDAEVAALGHAVGAISIQDGLGVGAGSDEDEWGAAVAMIEAQRAGQAALLAAAAAKKKTPSAVPTSASIHVFGESDPMLGAAPAPAFGSSATAFGSPAPVFGSKAPAFGAAAAPFGSKTGSTPAFGAGPSTSPSASFGAHSSASKPAAAGENPLVPASATTAAAAAAAKKIKMDASAAASTAASTAATSAASGDKAAEGSRGQKTTTTTKQELFASLAAHAAESLSKRASDAAATRQPGEGPLLPGAEERWEKMMADIEAEAVDSIAAASVAAARARAPTASAAAAVAESVRLHDAWVRAHTSTHTNTQTGVVASKGSALDMCEAIFSANEDEWGAPLEPLLALPALNSHTAATKPRQNEGTGMGLDEDEGEQWMTLPPPSPFVASAQAPASSPAPASAPQPSRPPAYPVAVSALALAASVLSPLEAAAVVAAARARDPASDEAREVASEEADESELPADVVGTVDSWLQSGATKDADDADAAAAARAARSSAPILTEEARDGVRRILASIKPLSDDVEPFGPPLPSASAADVMEDDGGDYAAAVIAAERAAASAAGAADACAAFTGAAGAGMDTGAGKAMNDDATSSFDDIPDLESVPSSEMPAGLGSMIEDDDAVLQRLRTGAASAEEIAAAAAAAAAGAAAGSDGFSHAAAAVAAAVAEAEAAKSAAAAAAAEAEAEAVAEADTANASAPSASSLADALGPLAEGAGTEAERRAFVARMLESRALDARAEKKRALRASVIGAAGGVGMNDDDHVRVKLERRSASAAAASDDEEFEENGGAEVQDGDDDDSDALDSDGDDDVSSGYDDTDSDTDGAAEPTLAGSAAWAQGSRRGGVPYASAASAAAAGLGPEAGGVKDPLAAVGAFLAAAAAAEAAEAGETMGGQEGHGGAEKSAAEAFSAWMEANAARDMAEDARTSRILGAPPPVPASVATAAGGQAGYAAAAAHYMRLLEEERAAASAAGFRDHLDAPFSGNLGEVSRMRTGAELEQLLGADAIRRLDE